MISLNMAMTLDGKVARPDGRWYGISSPHDRVRMDEIRNRHDAVVGGKNSLLNDNPNLVAQGDFCPVPVLLARTYLFPLDLRVLNQTRVRPLLLAHEALRSSPQVHGQPIQDGALFLRELEARADILWLDKETFTPVRLFALLRARGFDRILLETGPGFNEAVFRADLLDTLYLTLCPFIFGQGDLPGLLSGARPLPDFDQPRWQVSEVRQVGREVFLTYERAR